MQYFHVKRMYWGTAAEMAVLSLPADGYGFLFWQSDTDSMYIWDGSDWEQVGGGGAGGGHTIQEEGVNLPQRTNLNFEGNGVTATDDIPNDASVITIPGVTVEEDDGVPTVDGVTKIVVGNGDLTDVGGGEIRIQTLSDGTSGHVIQSEGIDETQRANLNFEGSGVSVADDAGDDATVVTIEKPTSDMVFHVDGALALATGVSESLIVTAAGLIQKVYAYVKDPGSANSTTIDIHKNSVTIFTVQANRPSIDWNDVDQLASAVPDVQAVAENDILTLDIDAIATDAAGLTVVIALDTSQSGNNRAGILEHQVFG